MAGGPSTSSPIAATPSQGSSSPTTSSTASPTATLQAFQNMYGTTFAPPTMGYVPQQARSNYDPARAQAMANASYNYQRNSAMANQSGYANTLAAWQQMRDKQAADKAAAEAKAKADAEAKAKEASWLSAMYGGSNGAGSEGNGQMMAGATGGLASLQGFQR